MRNFRGALVSVEEARQLARQLLAALEQHEEPAGATIRELFEQYMKNHGDRCRSARRIRQLFIIHLSSFAERPAGGVRSTEVSAWHNQIGNEVGQPTANRALEVIRAVYNKSIKWGSYSGSNPCMSVSVFPLDSRDRYLSRKEEIDRFLAALATMRSSTFRNFIKAALFTAARVNNVQSMRWEDLDFEQEVWRIPHLPKRGLSTKSGKPIMVPLIAEALEAIRAQQGKHDVWVFPGRGNTGHIVNPARAWKRLLLKAGIQNLRMHDLRRTMGSWQANTGASLQVIQKTLGHSSIRATHIYARLQLDPVRDAMVKAARAILS